MSKLLSGLGVLLGIGLVFVGLAIVEPVAATLGVLWIVAALALTAWCAANLVREPRPVEPPSPPEATGATIEQRLERLAELKDKGLVNEAEWAEQRGRILGEL